jgi:hypothetical protein
MFRMNNYEKQGGEGGGTSVFLSMYWPLSVTLSLEGKRAPLGPKSGLQTGPLAPNTQQPDTIIPDLPW